MPRLLLLALLVCATTASADEALLVWNDPDQMAIRMVRFDTRDPGHAKALVDLEPLKTISSTMTGVSSDGKYIGLCHQVLDENEAPASLKGFDTKGREIWQIFPRDLHTAINENLNPMGLGLGTSPDRLTFGCQDAGATGRPGELAFDLRLTGQQVWLVEGSGWVDLTMRVHIKAKTGKLIDVAGVGPKGSSLTLGPNPPAPIHRDPVTGNTFYVMTEGGFVIPTGGKGRALWSAEAIRWNGDPVGDGSDFAWFVTPAD